jgi:hypothetical protein
VIELEVSKMEDFTEGTTVYLNEPVKGYKAVTLIGQNGLKWIVETSSGMELEVYEDEFTVEF